MKEKKEKKWRSDDDDDDANFLFIKSKNDILTYIYVSISPTCWQCKKIGLNLKKGGVVERFVFIDAKIDKQKNIK
jgi:hypothetical protein